MQHESLESEKLASSFHRLWKYAAIASGLIATVNLFFAVGAVCWHHGAEREHEKDIQDKKNASAEHENRECCAVVSDEHANIIVELAKIGQVN